MLREDMSPLTHEPERRSAGRRTGEPGMAGSPAAGRHQIAESFRRRLGSDAAGND